MAGETALRSATKSHPGIARARQAAVAPRELAAVRRCGGAAVAAVRSGVAVVPCGDGVAARGRGGTSALSPGMTICLSSASVTLPVTLAVRKKNCGLHAERGDQGRSDEMRGAMQRGAGVLTSLVESGVSAHGGRGGVPVVGEEGLVPAALLLGQCVD